MPSIAIRQSTSCIPRNQQTAFHKSYDATGMSCPFPPSFSFAFTCRIPFRLFSYTNIPSTSYAKSLYGYSFNFLCEISVIFRCKQSPISSAANNLLSLFANMEPVKSFARTPLQRPLMQKPLCRMRNHSHSVEKLLLLAQIHLPFKTKQAPSKCDCEIVNLTQKLSHRAKKKSRVRICSRSNVFKSYF